MVKTKKKNMVDNSDTKRLAVLIALAIVVSLAGTVITLSSFPNGITGFATDSEAGTAQFTVAALTQITLNDATVNFGTCTLNPTNISTFDSNSSNGNSLETTDSSTCSGSFPDRMELENSGNKYVNLSVKSNVSATNYINANSGQGSFYYVGANKEGGSCITGLASTFTNFSASNTNYSLCSNFSPINTADELYISYRIKLPPDTREGTKSAQITITAEDVAQ
jgi:hypothetical protein